MTTHPEGHDLVEALRAFLRDGVVSDEDCTGAFDALGVAHQLIGQCVAALASEAASQVPADGWQEIATAPKDRIIWVYAPGVQELEPVTCLCQWHEDGGFCVDEVRWPTLWHPVALPAAPDQEGPADGK